MCGICGIIGEGSSDRRDLVQNMMARMKHRGPDGEGIWQSQDGRVTMGHVRLAIVDASAAGAQPMHHPSGLHSVVNGEIYNYPTLRQDLEGQSQFKSDCDSEIVLHGHAAFGLDFIETLNGMFAFALFDENSGTIILARDRLGIKPLYYMVHEGLFIFASEIKALFGAVRAKEWTIDRQGLTEYMTYQSPLGAHTLFEGVHQLRPGHHISLDLTHHTNVQQQSYWRAPNPAQSGLTFDAALTQLGDTFKQSVERHLLSDVAVASYLSAGFDSASVFAAASKSYAENNSDGLTAYTGRFDRGSAWYDETGPASELVREIGDTHITVDNDASSLPECLDDIVAALDEVAHGHGRIFSIHGAKRAAQDYKVILTGHGGDELFQAIPSLPMLRVAFWHSKSFRTGPFRLFYPL